MPIEPVQSAEEVSRLAFGFMASKALFAGLHVDVFSRLSAGPLTAQELAAQSRVPVNRLRILLHALLAVGLVCLDDEQFSNAPASELFLSSHSKYDFGDYLRYLRIPVHADHRFRCKPITHSGPSRSLIPVEPDHRFRCQADHFLAITGIVH